jgi:hypothetical protein
MPTAKPRYNGLKVPPLHREFSPQTYKGLRDLFPDKIAEESEVFAHPADEFVAVLKNEAWWAESELNGFDNDLTKPEIVRELEDLRKLVSVAEDRLRSISRDVEITLGIDADNLGCADELAELLTHFDSALERAVGRPQAKKRRDKEHAVAVELAVRVLRVLKGYGVHVSATAGADNGRSSDAVRALKLIGDHVGLCLAEVTWRDTIISARQKAADLN